MQILCQFSGEPAPQMDLHLTEEQGGAVPWALCWWALKVSGVLGKALGLCTLHAWYGTAMVSPYNAGNSWPLSEAVVCGHNVMVTALQWLWEIRVAVLPGRLVPLSWRFYGVSDNSLRHLIYKFLKRDFHLPGDWSILSWSHWIIGPRCRGNHAAAWTMLLPWGDGHGCEGQALSQPIS